MIGRDEARVNVTYGGQNGDLADTVSVDSTDTEIRQWVAEALRTGGVPGIPAVPDVDPRDLIIDRSQATDARPYNLIEVRSKTEEMV